MIRLGVNVDHVATLRNARGECYPNPIHAVHLAELGGADNITCHLREDRRHIRDQDLELVKASSNLPLNFEMAATMEMVEIALRIKPHAVTLVPERRMELTTEGGLDVAAHRSVLGPIIKTLRDSGALVSLFIAPDRAQIEASQELGAQAIEIHTGDFCYAMRAAHTSAAQHKLMKPLIESSERAHRMGLQVHFGHGLNYQNAHWLQLIPHAEEANIGHAIVAQALFVGFQEAVRQMKSLLNDPSFRP